MSKLAFDYSKWDNIEISDDEADTHPNIDKASWFRMKHRSRVEREETEKMEKTAMEKENKADSEREREIVRLLAEVRSGGDAAEYEDEDALVGELEEVCGRVEATSRRVDGVEPPRRRADAATGPTPEIRVLRIASTASRRRRRARPRRAAAARPAVERVHRRGRATEQERSRIANAGPRPRQGPPRQDRLHGKEQEVERRQLVAYGHGSNHTVR